MIIFHENLKSSKSKLNKLLLSTIFRFYQKNNFQINIKNKFLRTKKTNILKDKKFIFLTEYQTEKISYLIIQMIAL